MPIRALLAFLAPALLAAAPTAVLVRDTGGSHTEGQTQLSSLKLTVDGKTTDIKLASILSIHNAAAPSDVESNRITAGIAAILGTDRPARDAAVEELTSIGLPVLTPLLKAYKDTDQHEPRPLYRLFERIIPSYADGPDRSLSLVRLKNGTALRGVIADGEVSLTANGKTETMPWSKIRTLAVRQAAVKRSMQVHSLRHCAQIEYLDTAVRLTASSKIESAARGFVRLSWETDSWASDASGLTKPGSPAYKSHLFEGQPFGALIGRVGAGGEVFFLGKQGSKSGAGAGRLMLAINDNKHWQNNIGTFYVTMTVTDAYDLGDAQ